MIYDPKSKNGNTTQKISITHGVNNCFRVYNRKRIPIKYTQYTITIIIGPFPCIDSSFALTDYDMQYFTIDIVNSFPFTALKLTRIINKLNRE